MTTLLEAAEATRLKLREQGYSPIPVNGKRPLFNDWQKLSGISAEELSRLTAEKFDHTNTGALTALMPVLDIDIKDPAAAEAAEHLVRDRFGDTGKILIRIGSAPKRAIPFQTAKTFKKIAVDVIAPNGDTSQKIELMCDGQQVVVDGIHPDTGKPYTWFGDDLTEVSRYNLPHLNEAEARMLVQDVVELLVTEHGYTIGSSRPKKANGNGHSNVHTTGADDWAYLTGKIISGADLHDSIVALSAKLITNGMKAGAVINLIQGLMQQSTAPRDGRYWDRFYDIQRAVDTALKKFADSEYSDEPLTKPAGLEVCDAGADVDVPPPRGWLLGNTFCRKFLSSLLADGGVGKTAQRYAAYLSLTTARPLIGDHVFQRARVLIISLEDDIDELKRRILAARLHYGIKPEDIKGWLFYSSPGAAGGKLMIADRSGHAAVGRLAANIEAEIVKHQIDLVALDPFVKSHSIPENDNSLIDEVVQVLTDLAAKYNIAVDVPHHTSKGVPEPGNANRGRGASSMVDAGRLVTTLTPMSSDEAKTFGIAETERKQYIRLDNGKVNIIRGGGNPKWYRLIGVRLGNGNEMYPNGDEVQTVEQWQPPQVWTDLSDQLLNQVLTDIDAGLPDGERYSDTPRTTSPAWMVVTRLCPTKTEGQAREIIKSWVRNGVLVHRNYYSPARRKDVTGLYVDSAKRPGTTF